MLVKIKANVKIILAGIILFALLAGCVAYYILPGRMTSESIIYIPEERMAIVDEVKDYLVKYVVSDGFVNDISESEDLQLQLADKIKSGELVLLNEEQIDSIAKYAAENYNILLGSDLDALTDVQIQDLEKSIRENVIVTIGEESNNREADVNSITGGVSSIVIKNIMEQLDDMNDSIEQLQVDLNTVKENIALGHSFEDISDSITKLEDRLDYVKDNLNEEDQALAGDINEIEEDLRTLHVNVDETATVIVQLESTMDDLTKSNMNSLSVQIGDTVSAIDKINKEYQSILDKINSLQSSLSSKDTELSNIAKDAAGKVNDLSGLLAALQKELNNYKNATDRALKNVQDSQTVLDKNLSGYKDTTNKSLTNLFAGQETTDKNLSNYKNDTNKSLTNIVNDQNTTNKNLSDYQDITDADIINLYTLIDNIKNGQQTQEVDLTEIKNKLVSLDESMQQCFTSVSSGKKELASALTDKGIETDATAKFHSLAINISKIAEKSNVLPNVLLSGYTGYAGNSYIVGNMPNQAAVAASLNCGQSYTVPSGYHNGLGKIVANTLSSQTQATAIADNLSQGVTSWVNGRIITGTGADNTTYYNKGYTDGVNAAMNGAGISYTYHSHIGNTSGGGCYSSPIYHIHNSSCYTTVTNRCNCRGYGQGNFLGNHATDGYPIYACTNCPHQSTDHSGTCNVSSQSQVINCGKTETTIEFYDLGCGKTESTIESATIVFQ